MSIYGATKSANLIYTARFNLQNKLSSSVKENDFPGVQACLAAGALVTEDLAKQAKNQEILRALKEAYQQAAALYNAIVKNDVEKVKLLIDQKVNLNRPCLNEAYIPLLFAASRGCYRIVEALLKAGADIDVVNKDHITALHLAVTKNHLDIVNLLLEFGADPNIPAVFAMSPLMTAAKLGHLEVANVLLQHGADISYADGKGRTIFSNMQPSTPLHAIFVEHHQRQTQQLRVTEFPSLKERVAKVVSLMKPCPYQMLPTDVIQFITQIPEREGMLTARKLFAQESLNAFPKSFLDTLPAVPMEISDDLCVKFDAMKISKTSMF